MALVSVQDYIRLHNARSSFNPVNHTITIHYPNGSSAQFAAQLINGQTFINV